MWMRMARTMKSRPRRSRRRVRGKGSEGFVVMSDEDRGRVMRCGHDHRICEIGVVVSSAWIDAGCSVDVD